MLKEKVDKKRNLNDIEEIQLSANSGDIIVNHRVVKQKHKNQFLISRTLGEAPAGKALCDLRETVNLTSLSVFVQFNIGNLKPSTIKLKMGDEIIAHAISIVEDVLVKVDNFHFPIDFLVVNMQADKSVPLILG
ncbi:uncharacterized protein LOC125196518 [Salvia hispanica]|uniref:uncharacterized protein LOC125196518 n=1 Tax=Salvia hispanica TaxID=49212 RepID=UPI00200925B5|nr:uncharacterized protein LOC125196518 [Salvia hispanica]